MAIERHRTVIIDYGATCSVCSRELSEIDPTYVEVGMGRFIPLRRGTKLEVQHAAIKAGWDVRASGRVYCPGCGVPERDGSFA